MTLPACALYTDSMEKYKQTESDDSVLRYSIQNKYDLEKIVQIGKALSSPDRVRIMRMLSMQPMNLYQLSVNLALPFSSVHHHVDVLSAAGLVLTNYKPTPKGHEKVCVKTTLSAIIDFDDVESDSGNAATVEMPVGMYRECAIRPPCGMLSATGHLGRFDDPASFYSPDTASAELLWFNCGYVVYNFPHARMDKIISRISFTFELCSETMFFNNDWKSDITVEINDRECLTFTSLGDYGGRRGNYTPDFWPLTSTQYGRLWTVAVDRTGVYLDETRQTIKLTVADLHLNDAPFIKLKIGIKEDATHIGGLNLFGKQFGDFNQSIVMNVGYDDQPKPRLL